MVCILLGKGFEEAEAVVPCDLLRRAGIEVKLAAVEGRVVPSSHGVGVEADCGVDEVDPGALEMIVVPGGMGGVEAIGASPRALALIRETARRGAWVAAICAGPTVLAGLGLLEGRRCTCYPGLESRLTGACPVDEAAVIDGRVVTGRGPGAAFEFGYALITALRGAQAARAVNDGVHYGG